MKKIAIASLLLLVLSCKPVIKDLNLYHKKPVENTEFMPSGEQLSKSVPSIVVFEFADNTEYASKTGLKKFIPVKVESTLLSKKLAKILSRDSYKTLQNEITLAEMNGRARKSSASQDANFAMVGEISAINFSSRDITPTNTDQSLVSVLKKEAPIYQYTAGVVASAKIYSMPDMSVIETLQFEGEAKSTEKAKMKSDGLMSRQFETAKEFDSNLVQRAAEAAVKNSEVALKNVFAKTGYISEIREMKGKFIAKINLGSADGIAHGDKINLIQKRTIDDSLSGEEQIDSVTLGLAIVSNQITANSSWVVIKDPKSATELKIGDTAKVFYKKSLMDAVR